VYFPESGYTKRDLLAYYYRTADLILPFLRDRGFGFCDAYPDGNQGPGFFFQKDLREGSAGLVQDGSGGFRTSR